MIPLFLHAENLRSWRTLEFDFPTGAVAISGPVGAGKSTIVEGIELALYGECRTGKLPANLTPGEDMLIVELTFEHAGETYRARRTYSSRGRGKTTFDFERAITEGSTWEHAQRLGTAWEPLTRESQKETQTAVVDLIGLSHSGFRASCFIAQKDAGAFTEASPAERKAVLAEVVALDVWARLEEANRAEERAAKGELAALEGRIALLDEQAGDVAELRQEIVGRRETITALDAELAGAEKSLEIESARVREIETLAGAYREQVAIVESVKARLSEKQAIVDRAAQAKSEAVEVQRAIDEMASDESLEEAVAEEQRLRELISEEEQQQVLFNAEQLRLHDAKAKQSELASRASALSEEAQALRQRAEHVLKHVGSEHCDRCDQVLGEEAAQVAVASLREDADAKDIAAANLREQLEAVDLPQVGPVPVRDETVDARLQEQIGTVIRLRNAALERVKLRTRLDGLEATIAAVTPELTSEVASLAEAFLRAQELLAAIDEPEPGALERAQAAALAARGRLADVTARVTQAQAELARAEARLEQAQKIAEELAGCRARQAALLGDIDETALAARAFGRDGIPSLIVEARAIPAIEAEANEILAAFGEEMRVELRTQRELKSGDGLADALDIVVIRDGAERDYRTYSGGEGGCLNFALRVALARLLASRRAGGGSFLVVDEIEGFDEAHQAAFIEIVMGLRDEFSSVLIASHYAGLRDAPLDELIEVENVEGESRFVGEREAVLA